MRSPSIMLVGALIAGFIGGISGQLLQQNPTPVDDRPIKQESNIPNPFSATAHEDDRAIQIEQMQARISSLEAQLSQIVQKQLATPVEREYLTQNPSRESLPEPAVASEMEHLVAVGVDPDVANEILRSISKQQFRALELGNLMRSNAGPDKRRYAQELRELSENRISLRTELGDENYDQYLYASGKNNRVMVGSVMAGSPAETNGLQAGDVILRYDDKKIIDARDLQQATLSSAAGYANIEIIRDGNRMNLMLPQGTMGVQMQPIKTKPEQ